MAIVLGTMILRRSLAFTAKCGIVKKTERKAVRRLSCGGEIILNGTEIKKWMAGFQARVLDAFGNRVVFLGLQGSYGRGEQTPESDIDVVVILDKVGFADLEAYRAILEDTEFRDLICGFVAGVPELLAWEKYDLLQLYLDAVPYFGNLDFLKNSFSKEDIERAVRVGACNVYHAASHNYLHAGDAAALKEIYKAARFVVRMKEYGETGVYIPSMAELSEKVSPEDGKILAICAQPFTDGDGIAFAEKSKFLIEWAGGLIRKNADGGKR